MYWILLISATGENVAIGRTTDMKAAITQTMALQMNHIPAMLIMPN
jgi:hypothetical protein